MTKKEKLIEIIKVAHLKYGLLEITIPNLVKTYAYSQQKQNVQQEKIVDEVYKIVQTDEFISKVLPAYEDLTEEEVDKMLSYYKSDAMKHIYEATKKGNSLLGKSLAEAVLNALE
jgi:hypothetical protein